MSERYEIQEKIGQGGIGAVYRAYDTQLKRSVAIKRMLPSEEGANGTEDPVEMMLKEATTLSALQHPNIITVYDVGIDDDGAFVVMELLKGETLDQVIQRGVLTLRDFAEVVTQSMEALIAAEAAGVLHRDLKPTNVMVNWLPSKKFQVKILDFSLAKFSRTPAPQTIDQGDAIFGSIYFMAPEQFERGNLDKRTDLYSMGCLYYFCLSGQYPFQGDSAAQVMASHLQGTVIPINQVRSDLPEVICQWVMWLINRYPKDRPADAREAFENFQQLMLSAEADTRPVDGLATLRAEERLRMTSRRLIVPPPPKTTSVTSIPRRRDPTVQVAVSSEEDGESETGAVSATYEPLPDNGAGTVSRLAVLLGLLALIALGFGAMVLVKKNEDSKAVARFEELAEQVPAHGSAKDVEVLVKFLDGNKATAAKILLQRLIGDGVDESVVQALESANDPKLQSNLIDVVLYRQLTSANHLMAEMTQSDYEPRVIRKSLEALAEMGGMPAYLALLEHVQPDDQYESNLPDRLDWALESIGARLSSADRDEASVLVSKKLSGKTGSIRYPLIRILGSLGTPQAFVVLKQSLTAEGDDELARKERTAALAGFSNWPERTVQVTDLLKGGFEGRQKQRVLRTYAEFAFKPGSEPPVKTIIDTLMTQLLTDDGDLNIVRMDLLNRLPVLENKEFARETAMRLNSSEVLTTEIREHARMVYDRLSAAEGE